MPLKFFAPLDERVSRIPQPPAPLPPPDHVAGDPLGLSDLRPVAKFLAKQCEYDVQFATWCTASWYRGSVGEDFCNEAESRLLRELTIEHCRYVSSGQELRDSLKDYDPATGARLMTWKRAAKNLGEFALVAGMLLALVIGAAILQPANPDDLRVPSSTQQVAPDPANAFPDGGAR